MQVYIQSAQRKITHASGLSVSIVDNNLAGVVPIYIEKGEEAGRKWLQTEGFNNINALNNVIKQTAVSVKEKL